MPPGAMPRVVRGTGGTAGGEGARVSVISACVVGYFSSLARDMDRSIPGLLMPWRGIGMGGGNALVGEGEN